MSFVKDLDTPLLQLSSQDRATFRSLSKGGVHVFANAGGGKTSGPGRMLAGALLRCNAGGIVTAVKHEEIDLWKRYAAEHGRSSSLVLLNEEEGFNFLTYEIAREGMEGIGSVTECVVRILDASRRATGGNSNASDPFWGDSTRANLRYTIPPLYAAEGSLNVGDIIRFISSAPQTKKDVDSAEWQKHSFMYSVLDAATHRPKVPMPHSMLVNCLRFWSEENIRTPEKTRGNVSATIFSALDRFRHGRLNKVFCGKTTVVPEMTFNGAVIVLAMPTLTWHADGLIGQQLFKFLWQRAVLTRNSLDPKYRERFLFCYSDEAQETVNAYDDGDFLSVCRGSNACMVAMTQTLPSYFSRIGGANPRDETISLLSRYTTHVFGSNGCNETNIFASTTLGKTLKRRKNYSKGTSQGSSTNRSNGGNESSGMSISSGQSFSTDGISSNASNNDGSSINQSSGTNWSETRGTTSGTNESDGYSETMEPLIEAGEFARALKTGGPANNYEVTAIWFQSGHVFAESGSNILTARFSQK